MKKVEKVKKIVQYQCDKCKGLFDTKDEAIECENSHKYPVSLTDECLIYYNEKNEYPRELYIKFNDNVWKSFINRDYLG